MNITRAERRILDALKLRLVRFDFVMDAITQKIREHNPRRLESDCWEALALLPDYKRAVRKVYQMQDRKEPNKRAEREVDRELAFVLVDLVVMGGALRKSPKRIRKTLRNFFDQDLVDQVLGPRIRYQSTAFQ